MKRPYSPWTTKEWSDLERMAKEGATNKQIAYAIGRTQNAVAIRANMFRPKRTVKKSPVHQVAITKSDVPEFYELGWRFVGFKGDLCVFEWQSEREARWPEQMRAAA